MKTTIKSLAAATFGSMAMMATPAIAADSTTELVQALVSKGVLTEEEGALLSKGRAEEMDVQKKKEKKHWTGHVNIRGYVQNRNTTMLGGDEGVNLWSDRSVGDDRSFGGDKNLLIRRARVILFGDFGDHLSYYIQPDFASSAGTTGNIAQLRDAYGDVNIDATKVHRFRVGQSKVPYGFENLQSSSNRLALDRVDALNSAVRDERDLGVFYYYTPTNVQALFEEINKEGLKHSGNYGMLGLGFYNGQGANRTETNDNYHFVARATYPWKTESGQIFEVGVQGYHGQYVSTTSSYRTQLNRDQVIALNGIQTATPASPNGLIPAQAFGCDSNATTAGAQITSAVQDRAGVRSTCTPRIADEDRNGIKDERVGISLMMYPQPFGLQAEWNWGKTPGLDIEKNVIEEKSLHGGYIQAMYMLKDWHGWGTFIPFVKWQYFDGYNKAETNSPKNNVNDWEWGVEWQIAPEVELAAVYHRMKRNNLVTGASNVTLNKADYESFDAEALRVQLQYNF